MENRTLYDTTLAQDVVILQTKYCLDKRVVNIIAAMTSSTPINFGVMYQAFNEVVKRNDCLRIRFIKHKGTLKQYFEKEVFFDKIPTLIFKTEKEQNDFILKIRKKAIAYKKGVVIEPYFIKTFDNKDMVLFKVCHLILDLYGINMIYKDLFEVYEALLNKTELPKNPVQFEELIKKDLSKKHDTSFMKGNYDYFDQYYASKQTPQYSGISGDNSKIWKKLKKNNHIGMKLFFINCQTQGYLHEINKETVDTIINYCQTNKVSFSNFLFYAMNITCSKVNNFMRYMLPLELMNCRGTMAEKQCAGTKAQSIACHVEVDKNKTFKENLDKFCSDQMQLYRHVGCSDFDVQKLLHKNFKFSWLENLYGIAFSFIPFAKPEHLDFMVYSNGKCALPAYIGLLYDLNKGNIQVAYDCQTKIINEQDVKNYHNELLNVLNKILENPEIKVEEI